MKTEEEPRKFPGAVRCDADDCGWFEETDDLVSYADKNCPQCGAPIMNSTDKTALAVIDAISALGIARAVPLGAGQIRVDTDRRKQRK